MLKHTVFTYIERVGLAAPGLSGWTASVPILCGKEPYRSVELPVYQPHLLPPNERRRASPTVRMAFRVAEEATQGAEALARQFATVFVSADGDLQIANRILGALATPQRMVSPTDFHNSVHNAASGYWSIASGARGPSTAISAWDTGFCIGLLEALSMVHIEQHDTLLVAYDMPAGEPLVSKRSVGCGFGVALLLTAQPRATTLARLRVEPGTGLESTLSDPDLEAVRLCNPAARALPLLQLLARGQSGAIQLPASNRKTHDQMLRVSLEPSALPHERFSPSG